MEEQKRGRGRPAKLKINLTTEPVEINFDEVKKLKELNIDPRMMETMVAGSVVDKLISHEGGLPCATNIMFGGDPGVGKTTILLDYLASLQMKNRKCLFISAEMGKKQMKKYTDRFNQFGVLETLFISDFLDYNIKDVIEQVLDRGYDAVVVDSAAELLNAVRGEMDWDKKEAETWLVKVCVKNNIGENQANLFTSFLMIQQLNSSNGEFVGGNKLQYLFDGACKILRSKDSDSTYMVFIKNRNGRVQNQLFFDLSDGKIIYTNLEAVEVND